ncbi:MAG: ASKHA domain-containing protein [Candidatus Bathyarchaeia archaeon]
MDRVRVIFEPYGRRVEASAGELVFSLAKSGGVIIRSECGGKGVCGKCKVIVVDRDAVSKLTESERKHLAQNDIDAGYRLACQTRILKNTVIMVPHESRLELPKLEVEGLERHVKLAPMVRKFHLALHKPTLSDITPDLERLLNGVREVTDLRDLNVDPYVLRRLPYFLRIANWNVTLVVHNQEIIEIEPGDTSSELFGLAVDIGTSKIVCHIVDLTCGGTVSIESIENPQAVYGEDIISRITYASSDEANLKELQNLAVEGLNKVLSKACQKVEVEPEKIYEVVVVGNTAMHHIFFGIQTKYVAQAPYVPALRRAISMKARDLGVKINPCGVVSTLPIVAGFVGADAVADVLATGIHESDENSLLVDIGTNTEIFVGSMEGLLCCSCASGPAFEGMHIRHGMRAVVGAIEKVRIQPNFDVEYETVGNVRPVGLCGSAVIDAIAEMYKRGIIGEHGRINHQIKSPRIRRGGEGLEFVIAWRNETATGTDIIITQKDIREIQLAKAAIYSGCSILMKKKGLTDRDIDALFIAGAFGNYLNPENAKIIGLLPNVPTEKIRFVGNTAITGAKMALISKEARDAAELLIEKIRYHELAADQNFYEEFINAIYIPHRIKERFQR